MSSNKQASHFKKSKVFAGSLLLAGLTVIPTAQIALATGPVKSSAKLLDNAVAARHGKLVGHAAANQQIPFTITLKLRDTSKLDAFLSNVNNPSSPEYHHYLTPAEFAIQFGPTAAAINQVKSFLERNGISSKDVSVTGTLLHAKASVAQVEHAFAVQLNNYQDDKGQTYYANDGNPQIPANLASVVLGVQGLDNAPHWHRDGQFKSGAIQTGPRLNGAVSYVNGVPSHAGNGPAGGYTPTQLRGAYDVAPLLNSGTNGSGQTVALFELDGYVQSNISTYDSHYGLGSPTPSRVLVDGYSGAAGQGQGEVELDIEVIHAIAPKANVMVYEGPNTDSGVIDTYQKMATDDNAKAISTSWGESERLSNTSTMNSMHAIFQQMAAQGQSTFAAAGDSGAYDGGSSAPNTLAVDSPGNDPLVTGVGGTNLQVSNDAYAGETVWANTSDKSGGGGGLSTVYSKPSWQTGPGTSNSYSNGMRQVPDVSADADPASGYSIYSGGSWVVYGGTSCAAPLWAGIAALNNQYASANGKGVLGQANPTLYKMFNSTQTYSPFHDVTNGNNLYYPATVGYDQASGIGTPDAYNLIRDINATSGTTTPTPSPSPTPTPAPTTTQVLTNGGFENGSNPWVEYSKGGYELIDGTSPHSGSDSVYLAGYNGALDSIYQTVTIPVTTNSAKLSFWTYVDTTETSHSYDFFYAEIRSTSGQLLKVLQRQSDATASGWKQQSFDLSAYKGKTVRVYFVANNDNSNPTSFFLDDVSLLTQ